MHYIAIRSLLLALCSGVLTGMALGQESQQRDYSNVTFIDVKAGMNSEFRQFRNEISDKVLQVRADAGEISSHRLMRLRMPTGSSAPYDYIVVNTPANGLGMETMSTDEALKKAGIAMSGDEYWARMRELTSLVNREIWYKVLGVGELETGDFMVLDLMRTRNMGAWLELEEEVFMPVHQAMVDAGAKKAWSTHRLFMPAGSSIPYNAATATVYKDMEALGKVHGSKYFEIAHPDFERGPLGPRIRAARELVGKNLYRIVTNIVPTPEA